jgi:phospholipid/cholesterol/gamma-HCH transport system ATP-binding protein
MTEMIRVENITYPESMSTTSFTINAGEMTLLLTPKDEVSSFLTRAIIGLEKPVSGSVFLLGTVTGALTVRELHEIRRRIGVAFGSGGLISNLRIWENLALPLSYHQNLNSDEIVARGSALLERLGFTGSLTALPGNLTTSQKKIVGVARAMLIDPDVMVYESPVSGLTQEEKANLYNIITEFHREKPGRASLLITSDQEAVQCIPDASVVTLIKGADV